MHPAKEQAIIAKLVRWQQRRFPLVEGQLNNNAYTLLRAFNRYGVSRAAAAQHIVERLGHHCEQHALLQLVANAYQHTAEHNTRAFQADSTPAVRPAPAPPPTPLRANPAFTLSPTQLARLAQWQQQDRQRSSTAPMPLPPPPSVSSSTATAQPQQPVSSSTPAPVHEGTAPEPGAIVQGDERPAAAPVGTSPAEQVHQRSTHDDGAVTLLRCMQRKHPYTMALELYVQAGVNLTGARVAQLLRDMDNERGRSASN